MSKRAGTGGDREGGPDGPAPDLATETARILAGQAAALTVMTAYGMQMAGRMTGLMLEALADMADKADKGRTAQGGETAEPARPEPAPVQAGHATEPAPGATDKVVALKPKAAATPKKAARPARPAPADLVRSEAALAAGDDLKRISGIGPRLERVLKEKGVVSLAQIAAWTAADMKRIDAELGLEDRVIRDDWAGQAKALLEG